MTAKKSSKRTFPVKILLSKKSKKNLEAIPYRKLLFLSIGLSIITIFIVLFLQQFLPPEVPLFYGRPIPENKLSSALSLIIPSMISLGIIALNFGIAYLVGDIFLKRILIASTLAASLLSAITTIRIIFLVGSI